MVTYSSQENSLSPRSVHKSQVVDCSFFSTLQARNQLESLKHASILHKLNLFQVDKPALDTSFVLNPVYVKRPVRERFSHKLDIVVKRV